MSYVGSRYDFHDKQADYARLAQELAALLAGETDLIANAANAAALIFDALPEVNWAGFYFLKGGELIVGPFQGKPACVRIALGRGVCGTAAARCGVALGDRGAADRRRHAAGRTRYRQPAPRPLR